ncbi:TonB-dependent receptor domain-containing protein [Prevotella koreensis]|uniref:TonB-dependent receptor n=1 Tax=Prevotella koreensis TaxID=2490854 RepID=UPI0028EC49A2|nr:TonB-dependent receptor [Prevotella koreensis]
MLKRIYFIIAMLMISTSALWAQVTTSSMSGLVRDAQGETIIGATVQAVHEPSGTRYAAVTNTNGRFTMQGMRNGGPYKVTISYVGYKDIIYRDITLQLGEMYDLDANLNEDVNELGEVVVTGKGSKFAIEKTGATTNINQRMITSLPSVNRSISDIARLSPYANGMGFAGGDGRSTNFTIDGANFNNNFGLSDKLPGGGSPISMDAIDEVQVVVSPFDVRQSNFIGGGINAVTKSGTNIFRATAYTYARSEYLRGNVVNGKDLGDRKKDRKNTYGFTFGGPIIKDRLFFFANVEYEKIPTVTNNWRASADGVADAKNYFSRTTIADMEAVRNFMLKNYGYDTGSYTSFPSDEDNLKILARIDWNISQKHHLAVRFNHTNNTSWIPTNRSSSDVGTPFSGDRLSKFSMAFANSMYSMNNKVMSISADLNSRLSNNISNQLLFTYSNIQDQRGSNSAPFPFIDIMAGYKTDAGGTVTQTLEPYMSLGYELFSWNNAVNNKVTTLTDNFTYYIGTHKLTAGLSFEHQLANNSYLRNGTGYYRYRSLDDFLNGAAPESVAIQYGYNGNAHPAAQVRFNQFGFYLQDEWNIRKNLKLTAGVRFDDIIFNNDDVMTNNAILNLDFGGRHIDTGKWPNSNVQISPRLGFIWDVLGDKTLKVRGGTGLFAGRLPLVFFTNMPTNSGMIQYLATATTTYSNGVVQSRDDRLDKFAGRIVTDPAEIISLLGTPTSITPEQGTVPSSFAGVDRNFKMPQVWKSSIAVDYQLPVSFPMTITGEFTYTKNINAVMLDNYNVKHPDDTWSRLEGADNRWIYPKDFRYYSRKGNGVNLSDACVLTNTSKGYGWTANLTLNAEPVKDLNIMAAYTHTVMKEVSGMPGSNASSAWKNLYTINGPNNLDLQNSRFVIPDRVVASVNYRFFKENITLFYTGFSSSGYSFFYKGDINGDGLAYDLMYIPLDDSQIKFSSESDRAAFWRFVEQDSYLNSHRGKYAEAYSVRPPWTHRFDFRWTHDFVMRLGKDTHKLQLSADIMNIGNLFNSKWGVGKTMLPCNNGQFLKVDKIENGTPIFSMVKVDGRYPTKTWETNYHYGQCWQLQFGVKYIFN